LASRIKERLLGGRGDGDGPDRLFFGGSGARNIGFGLRHSLNITDKY